MNGYISIFFYLDDSNNKEKTMQKIVLRPAQSGLVQRANWPLTWEKIWIVKAVCKLAKPLEIVTFLKLLAGWSTSGLSWPYPTPGWVVTSYRNALWPMNWRSEKSTLSLSSSMMKVRSWISSRAFLVLLASTLAASAICATVWPQETNLLT